MLHKEMWGLTLLAFILWIFLGAAQQRLERVCAPIGWVGNVTVSMSALVVPSYQQPVQKWFDKFAYGCQYTTWRLFYQEDFNKWQEREKAKAEGKIGDPKEGEAPVEKAGLDKENKQVGSPVEPAKEPKPLEKQ